MRHATLRSLAAGRALVVCVAVLAVVVLAAAPARAVRIDVPLLLDPAFLRQALVEQLFRGANESARLLDDGQGCNELVLSHPVVFGENDAVRIRMAMQSRFGTPVNGRCALPIDTSRDVEVMLRPLHGEGSTVVAFRVVDSRILARSAGVVAVSSGLLWDMVKQHVHPWIGAYRIDLASPLDDLRSLLPGIVGPTDEARVQAIVDSVTLASVSASAAGVRALLHADVPPLPGGAPPSRAEPRLTPEEYARFEQQVSRFDGFLTHVVKHTGSEAGTREDRDELLSILIDARGDMLTALDPAQPRATAGIDPVQQLFRITWARLAPVMRRLGGRLPGAAGLRMLSFVASGDAVNALDRAGRETGFELSEDGLRRMARIVAPARSDDPLAAPDRVDPEMREIFGFGAPIESVLPPEPAAESEPTSSPEPVPAPEALPAPETAPVPGDASSDALPDSGRAPDEEIVPPLESPEPRVSSSPRSSRESDLRVALSADAGAPRCADPRGDDGWTLLVIEPVPLADLSRQLQRFVPRPTDLDRYLPLVREVLQRAAQLTLDKLPLDPSMQAPFRWMVMATAWKESCWRQFVREGGAVQPIRSPVGAVGMMQINARVWRGFYDVAALGTDAVYNARAGSEILHHYLKDLALAQGEHETKAGVDGAVRASYAAYNGGPRHLRRWRKPATPRLLRKIDESFHAKYRAVRDGRELEVRECLGG